MRLRRVWQNLGVAHGGARVLARGWRRDRLCRSLPGHAKLSLTSTGRDIVLCFKVVPRFFPGKDAGCQRQQLEKKKKKKKKNSHGDRSLMGATANDNVDTLQGRTMSEFQTLSDRFKIIHRIIHCTIFRTIRC